VTGAVLDRPGSLFADAAAQAERSAPGGSVTLHELLDSALHRAQANGSAECPVCHARMTRTISTRAHEPSCVGSGAGGGVGGGVGGGAGEALAAICGGCGSRWS
jgi:outer membrane lipoprotein SlyB